MSSCAASCSICCHPDSSAFATSDSLPTGNALRSCRYACNCSAVQSGELLGRHQRTPKARTHSGTAQSAGELCTSSSGSLLRNSCFAHRLNQTGAPLEPLFPLSSSTRAPARTQIPCLIRPKPLARQSLQTPHLASESHADVSSGLQTIRSYPNLPVPHPAEPAQTDAKYIAFHEGGFLQVAISEAPCSDHAVARRALQIQH